jgi:hypothetical protein
MHAMTDTPTRGAYGFAIRGAGQAERMLIEAPSSWPELSLQQVIGAAPAAVAIGADRAVIELLPSGTVELDRRAGTVIYAVETPMGVDALVHPYLAPAAAVHAAWKGWEPYHAAGVVIEGRVWGIAGDREVGKSTLVAALHAAGHPVMSDDLLVLEGETVFCGPRTVDLREAAAERFGATRDLGVTGMRRRWRIDLGAAPATARFAGWIYPVWSERISVTSVPLQERLERPQQHRAASFRPTPPGHAMWLAGRPAYEFARPQSWEDLDAATEVLVATLRSAHSESSSE